MSDEDILAERHAALLRQLSSHGELLALLAEQTAKIASNLDVVRTTVEAHTRELQAIREVIDNDLASHGDAVKMDGDLLALRADLQALRRLTERRIKAPA